MCMYESERPLQYYSVLTFICSIYRLIQFLVKIFGGIEHRDQGVPL